METKIIRIPKWMDTREVRQYIKKLGFEPGNKQDLENHLKLAPEDLRSGFTVALGTIVNGRCPAYNTFFPLLSEESEWTDTAEEQHYLQGTGFIVRAG